MRPSYRKVGNFGGGASSQSSSRLIYACLWLFVAFVAIGLSIAAFVIATRNNHWRKDTLTNDLVSKPAADVEIRSGFDLKIHNRLLHSGTDTAIDKIAFSPVIPFLPDGPDFLFGDQGVTYTRIQAGLAIGFRLGAQATFPIFFEPGLSVLIQPFGIHFASPFFNPLGTFVASDERIKTDIAPMDEAEAFRNVLELRARTYRYVDEFYDAMGYDVAQSSQPRRRGFVAQEVETVLPNSVRETIFNLRNASLEDFKDLRKEDIIVEAIAAVQYLAHRSVVEEASRLFPRDPFAAPGSGLPTGTPSWMGDVDACVRDAASPFAVRSKCVCDALAVVCAAHGEATLCQPYHPLTEQCAALP